MTTIFKYPLVLQDEQIVQMPVDARPLSVGLQRGSICLWMAARQIEDPREDRIIYVVGTGIPTDKIDNAQYVGSVQDGPFVWHIFIGRVD